MATKVNPKRVLLVEVQNESVRGGVQELRVEVPRGGRATFGPAIPAPPHTARYAPRPAYNEYALRIYGPNGEKDLIAVIPRVLRFRDVKLGYSVVERNEPQQGQTATGTGTTTLGAAVREMLQPGVGITNNALGPPMTATWRVTAPPATMWDELAPVTEEQVAPMPTAQEEDTDA